MRTLTCLTLLMLLNVPAHADRPFAGNEPNNTSKDSISHLSKNICDKLEELGSTSEMVNKCRNKEGENYGISAWYKRKLELDSEKQEEDRQNRLERQALEEAIERKTYSRQELKDLFGLGELEVIASEVIFDYYNSGAIHEIETKTVGDANAICKILDYDKAESAKILDEEFDATKMTGKSIVINSEKEHLFDSRDPKLKPYSWETEINEHGNVEKDKNVKLFQSITCVKSSVENNRILDAIELVTVNYDPNQSQQDNDTQINNDSRSTASDSEGDFGHGETAEDNILFK